MVRDRDELTPLLKQYQEIKTQYPDAILFFRLGDFYEMFFEDAEVGSRIMGVALTSRDKHRANPIPLCGVPAHAASGYIAKLIRAGYKVAICEQMEDPRTAKGLVRREVVRVITPGTVLEEDLLQPKENHDLACLLCDPEAPRWGISVVDLSTGEFWVAPCEPREEAALEILGRWNLREILAPGPLPRKLATWVRRLGLFFQEWPPEAFDPQNARDRLQAHFGTQTERLLEGLPEAAVGSAGALLQYLQTTQRASLAHIPDLQIYSPPRILGLDEKTQQHLDLTGSRNSLAQVLDHTRTPMGGRMLRRWVRQPLQDLAIIEARLDAVALLREDLERRTHLQLTLEGVRDVERLITRVVLSTGGARDLVALAQSLASLSPLLALLPREPEGGRLGQIARELQGLHPPLEDFQKAIQEAFLEDPAPGPSEGPIFREGFHPELDQVRELARDSRSWMARMEAEERARTGIDNLKIGYHRVFGYYIEVTRSQLSRVPPHYIRKQTLAQAERFITPELKALEERVLGAEERRRQLEAALLEDFRRRAIERAPQIQRAARLLGEVDVLASLAEAAHRYHYTRPRMEESLLLEIREGRHPVVEQCSTGEAFVPNDTLLDGDQRRMMILTGPNMAGKSTYMRQVALIVLMAQMGSFVPAQEARIGLVDRIFTRIGASDNLAEGRSTFLVEMEETAEILHQATPRSLVLLDEVGRGTSTYDGISIAWAVVEHLHHHNRCRTLFATHYHELTHLARRGEGIFNARLLVREWKDQVIFLRKLAEGPSDRSYGIQVARLAGLPETVIQRAREILDHLESPALESPDGLPPVRSQPTREPETGPSQLSLFAPAQEHPVLEELRRLDPLKMTPLEALQKLDDLRRKALS